MKKAFKKSNYWRFEVWIKANIELLEKIIPTFFWSPDIVESVTYMNPNPGVKNLIDYKLSTFGRLVLNGGGVFFPT